MIGHNVVCWVHVIVVCCAVDIDNVKTCEDLIARKNSMMAKFQKLLFVESMVSFNLFLKTVFLIFENVKNAKSVL